MFDHYDFTDFWCDNDYARENHIEAAPSDALIAEIEQELGYQLPASYIWLMRQHNGGIPSKSIFPASALPDGTHFDLWITDLMGIGRTKAYSLCGAFGSPFMIDAWGYPPIGVAICHCPSAGHDMVFLDYRACGPQGEPKVVHVSQARDYEITPVADSFESFIKELIPEEPLCTPKAETPITKKRRRWFCRNK